MFRMKYIVHTVILGKTITELHPKPATITWFQHLVNIDFNK